MTSNAADFVQRQADLRRQALARDVQYLADDAARLADVLRAGDPDTGRAASLAQQALQIALAATRLDGMAETIAYLKAENGES